MSEYGLLRSLDRLERNIHRLRWALRGAWFLVGALGCALVLEWLR